MLSAQKQQTLSNTQPEGPNPPKVTGFGKVLNSIQGLQQRLDDFSVEEVSRAHNTALNLIRELDHLHAQLSRLAQLKNAVFIVNTQVEAIPEDNFDLVAPDSLDKHPQLRAIVQAGKLIRMHRMLGAAQAGSHSASLDLQTTLPSSDLSADQAGTVRHASPEFIEQTSQTPLATGPHVEAGAGADRISSETHQRSVLADSRGTRDSKAKPAYDFSELKLEKPRETVSLRKDGPSQPKSSQQQTLSRKSRKPKGKPQIDQQLLSDLIEAYGEFAISTKTAAATEAEDIAQAAFEELVPVRTSIDPVVAQLKPAETAFLLPPGNSELAAPKQERQEPIFDGPSPIVKSQGEIDRQLKSIIKDYGEYDLYSDRKPLKTKAVVMAVIAGLALMLGGFYLFRAPSGATPPAIERTATPGPNPVKTENSPPSTNTIRK